MADYSPYNKTYRYILYQNQAYHQRNKHNASPQVKTNLKHSMSRISPLKNPQNNFEALMYRSTRSQSSHLTQRKANLFLNDNQISNVMIDHPVALIHKNESFQKFNKKRIDQSNSELVGRMINTQCQVVKKEKAIKQFQQHRKYQMIRTKFNKEGNRRQGFSLGNAKLLCPTLTQYMKSGLGKSFLTHLSVYNKKKALNKHPQ